MSATIPCVIYTRKSSEEGLEQEFNSLHAQREACEAYITSQKAAGWKLIPTAYDDGGYSGGDMQRPALQQLLSDIRSGHVRIVVVYKVDRLTRSLADFAKLIEAFDARDVSFVSVTQQFNTTTSMGRLTLNVLLSFAQFEREVTGERIRDKVLASKKKGMWTGGNTPMGYVSRDHKLYPDPQHAGRMRELFQLYLEVGSVPALKAEIDRRGWRTPERMSRRNKSFGGRPLSAGHLRTILQNRIYRGEIEHKGAVYSGQHEAIIDKDLWEAVQGRIGNLLHQHRIRVGKQHPTLLAGLIVDSDGNRFSVDHANKKGRRYHYYVCERAHPNGSSRRADRIPARHLDGLVIDHLAACLRDPTRMEALLKIENPQQLSELARAEETAHRLCRGSASDQISIVRECLQQVIVHPDQVILTVQWQDARAVHDGGGARADTIAITVPVTLKRSGVAIKMAIPPSDKKTLRMKDSRPAALLAKAYDWATRLTSGRYDGVQAIASEVGVAGSYVTRVIYLACLAPDLAMRIMKGDHPQDLTAQKLLAAVPLPERWEDQRKLIRLDSR